MLFNFFHYQLSSKFSFIILPFVQSLSAAACLSLNQVVPVSAETQATPFIDRLHLSIRSPIDLSKMAPIPNSDLFPNRDPLKASSPHIFSRQVRPNSLAPAIIVLSVISTVLFFSMACVLVKVIAAQLASRSAKLSPKDTPATKECKASDWARKNSNVLWSVYIEEDDLKSQFGLPAKSRLFSIGSVSTVDHDRCPLDRRISHVSDPSKPQTSNETVGKPEDHEHKDEEGDNAPHLRNRATYEQETTPTKNVSRVRAMSQPFKHRHTNSLEERPKRKQSVPARIPRPTLENQ